jgi:hypothetical protein
LNGWLQIYKWSEFQVLLRVLIIFMLMEDDRRGVCDLLHNGENHTLGCVACALCLNGHSRKKTDGEAKEGRDKQGKARKEQSRQDKTREDRTGHARRHQNKKQNIVAQQNIVDKDQ